MSKSVTATQRGFTLLEVLIALSLAAVISVALAMAMRLGLRFMERSHAFYEDLQDTQIVIGLLTRELAKSTGSKIDGDSSNVLLVDQKLAYRCRESAGELTLERYPIPDTKPNEEPVIEAEALLEHLKRCQFGFLVGSNEASQSSDTQPAAAEQKRASWQDAVPEKAMVLAIRLTLTGREQEWPPLVMLPKAMP